MSIETKREQLVSFLKDINDEDLIDRISEYVSSLKNVGKDMFTPMSEEELERRLAISRKDYEEGRYYTLEEVEEMSAKW
ncbi:hypothetical protein LNQ81_10760 [Myroides sp. M-43]|uniref:hypothetical protein n=1 Tax=Myroides oncorhynchi TaxID=2893756 RepID=UPI001E4A2A30|nr:hypothetical protein [Myroides oncorhynchi]MCC9043154.1 hypothetical protein [Myroides oncorhynchi]